MRVISVSHASPSSLHCCCCFILHASVTLGVALLPVDRLAGTVSTSNSMMACVCLSVDSVAVTLSGSQTGEGGSSVCILSPCFRQTPFAEGCSRDSTALSLSVSSSSSPSASSNECNPASGDFT